MQITDQQLKAYERDGYLLLPGCFTPAEVDVMKGELPALFAEDSPRRVVEKEGGIVRSVYGSHATNEVFHRLARHPRLLKPAERLVGGNVYVYQFKINAKAAFGGDLWDWHQDYVFWRKEDGMPAARVTNAAIFLDDVNEFNGPMFFIPGSHREGMIDVPPADFPDGGGQPVAYTGSPAWISNLTANIKYSVDREAVARLVGLYGITAPKGPSGSILFFHCNIVHASPINISPFGRVIIFISYNSTENMPAEMANPRPEFLSSRDGRPLVPVADDALFLPDVAGNAR